MEAPLSIGKFLLALGAMVFLSVVQAPAQDPSPQFLAERLAKVTGAGQRTEKERDPEGYKKLEEEIEKAIRRGAAWLKKQPQFRSSPLSLIDVYPTIGIFALLHAGEFERDPALAARCFDYLNRRPLNNTPAGTYAAALTAMALRDWDPQRNSSRVFECAQWLVENQGWDQTRKVWRYGDRVPSIGDAKKPGFPPPAEGPLEVVHRGLVTAPRNDWDNSCSQFAVLGLHSAALAGI
jgi:hypothetical protein